MAEDTDLVLDKSVVAAIDFRLTKIYLTDATPDRRPEHIVARDPRGYFHEVHHRAGNPGGTYEADDPEYWREVTEALAPAGAILVLGHGQGKANASHHWVTYERSTVKMSRRRSSQTCASTSTISMMRRSCGWRST